MSPLVLLHGFAGAPSSWDAVRAHLPADVHVVAPWLAGHGAQPAAASSFTAEVDRLAELARAEGAAGGHVAGYSLGGRLALGLLVRHPALFARATLISMNPGLAAGDGGQPNAVRLRSNADERWASIIELEGTARFAAAWEDQALFASQASLPEAVRVAQRLVRAAHRPRALAQAMRSLSLARMPDFRPALPGLTVPVTLLTGALDDKFTTIARATAARLQRPRLCVVPGAGHNLLLEAPAVVAEELAKESA